MSKEKSKIKDDEFSTKCPKCNKEMKYVSQELFDKSVETFEDDLMFNLMQYYPHFFLYCPDCARPILHRDSVDYDTIEKGNEIFRRILDNPLINEIDEEYIVRSAESFGYACELLKETEKQALAYRASADLLQSEIRRYIKANSRKGSDKNGDVSILSKSQMIVLQNAIKHLEYLVKLTLGVCHKNIDTNSIISCFVMIRCLIELGHIDDAQALLQKFLGIKDLEDGFKLIVNDLMNYSNLCKSKIPPDKIGDDEHYVLF